MTIEEILEYLLSSVPDEYDILVGSFFYDLLYPVAEQVYLLQSKINTLSTNTFALTATGEYLDRKVAEQGIARKAATYASGIVKITGNRGEIIQKGSKVAADNILFAVKETVSISECGYVDVLATCIVPGTKGNVKENEINRFPITLPGLISVNNDKEFTGGYNAETDEELLERYIEKVSRPNVSGNKYHYIEWAKEVNGVGNVQVIPSKDNKGYVKVIITNSDNLPANKTLIDAVSAHIEENRPIGAKVTVVSASDLAINISVELAASGSDTIQSDIENSIKKYLADMSFKQSYISYAKIGGLILAVNGVRDYSKLKINGGTDNINLSDEVVPVLGDVVII